MPLLPLKQKPYANVESVGNAVAIEGFYDADKDDFFNNKIRKGLVELLDLNTSKQIDGLFNPLDSDIVVAISDGKIFKIEASTYTEITGATLNSGIPVKMADFGDTGYFCNNSRIVKWTYADSTCSYLTDPQAPTDATHLGFIDQYLLALKNNSQRFDWSDTGDPDTWLGEFASAESRPDNLVALITAFGEVFLPGTKTIEHWADTGNPIAPFQRIPGTMTERGSLSPYSFVQVDNSFMFLDEERRVIRMNGRDPQVISNPFDSEFQSLIKISDAIGMHFNAEGDTKYIITFPTDNKTFVYDYKLDFWARWSYWDELSGTRDKWIGNCGVLIPSLKRYLVGSAIDGKIYIASKDYNDDAGNTINCEIITGRFDWGTSNRKSSTRLRLKIKRGIGSLSESKKLIINYRDNGKTEWSHDKVIDLGIAGDNESYHTFRNLKTYRDRQWRFKLTSGDLLLVNAEEDLKVI